jgi:hypothetical protein
MDLASVSLVMACHGSGIFEKNKYGVFFFLGIIWSIWNVRNNLVFNKEEIDLDNV